MGFGCGGIATIAAVLLICALIIMASPCDKHTNTKALTTNYTTIIHSFVTWDNPQRELGKTVNTSHSSITIAETKLYLSRLSNYCNSLKRKRKKKEEEEEKKVKRTVWNGWKVGDAMKSFVN